MDLQRPASNLESMHHASQYNSYRVRTAILLAYNARDVMSAVIYFCEFCWAFHGYTWEHGFRIQRMGKSKEQFYNNSMACILSHRICNPGTTMVKEQFGSALWSKDEEWKSENSHKGERCTKLTPGVLWQSPKYLTNNQSCVYSPKIHHCWISIWSPIPTARRTRLSSLAFMLGNISLSVWRKREYVHDGLLGPTTRLARRFKILSPCSTSWSRHTRGHSITPNNKAPNQV